MAGICQIFRIENPKNMEGGMTHPAFHLANFTHLMIIAYPRGQGSTVANILNVYLYQIKITIP